MSRLQAAAIDIDGVLLADTFSPVIKILVEKFGGIYDREVERHVFSQNRQKAARYLLDRLGLSLTEEEFISLYFQTRDGWLAENGGGPNPGIDAFLDIFQTAGLRLVCYGGLPQSHFEKELAPWVPRFERYICTNDFRPGVVEIVGGLGLRPEEVLFVDDVSRVAEAARDVGSPFVGFPAAWPWGHQRRDMEAVGVPVLLSRLTEFTPDLLSLVSSRAARGYWSPS